MKLTRAGARSWRGSAPAPSRDGGSLVALTAHDGGVRDVGGGGGQRAEGRGGTADARRKEAGMPGGGARAPGSGKGRRWRPEHGGKRRHRRRTGRKEGGEPGVGAVTVGSDEDDDGSAAARSGRLGGDGAPQLPVGTGSTLAAFSLSGAVEEREEIREKRELTGGSHM
uniref:Uncharacterized protein n=1 Tax=Oryza sativa subsp. japonica TaxID=39947 RepID=Q653N2_ORYSJ|nr:hypothetical protein [Oryza sativa Japonica Group]